MAPVWPLLASTVRRTTYWPGGRLQVGTEKVGAVEVVVTPWMLAAGHEGAFGGRSTPTWLGLYDGSHNIQFRAVMLPPGPALELLPSKFTELPTSTKVSVRLLLGVGG